MKSTDLRDYARQLSERKRLEDQKRKEDNFLRRSLRQSDKLRSLAHAKKAARDLKAISTAQSNKGFDSTEGSFRLIIAFTSNPDLPYKFEPVDYGTFIRDLRERLKKDPGSDTSDIDELGDQEWEWLANKVSDKSVLQAFNLHDVIASALEQTRAKMGDIPMRQWAGDNHAIKSLNAVTWDIQHVPLSDRTSQMNELLRILIKPNVVVSYLLEPLLNVDLCFLQEVLNAFDDVKQVWENQPEKENIPVDEDTVERTVYSSPVEGCYKILAVDDQGNTVSTPDGTTLVNVILQKSNEDFFVSSFFSGRNS